MDGLKYQNLEATNMPINEREFPVLKGEDVERFLERETTLKEIKTKK